MKTVVIHASRTYNVHIGAGLMSKLSEYICPEKKVCIISDSNVWQLYGTRITDTLQKYTVCSFVLPAGEESKNGENYLKILNFMAENAVTRSDLLIALGGGVVGDIAGFAAATYLRGIDFIQIPTTLLAMVDSSVGGKTAIDLPAGKNLAGAFYQPSLVLCDLNALNTLPADVFCDGCAEVIKYGILFDADLFSHLVSNGTSFDREYVISRCVELKRNVVVADEFDTGLRQQLNLGHTFGHGIEKCSNYTVSHGKAVAIGMCIAAKISAHLSFCNTETADTIIDICKCFHLPTQTDDTADMLFTAALSDKKRFGAALNLILPRKIGECFIHPIQIDMLKSLIKAGL